MVGRGVKCSSAPSLTAKYMTLTLKGKEKEKSVNKQPFHALTFDFAKSVLHGEVLFFNLFRHGTFLTLEEQKKSIT